MGRLVFLIFAQNIHQPGEEDGSTDGPVEIPIPPRITIMTTRIVNPG